MAYEQLRLENQFCFPVYAASRLITRAYQPHLDGLGLTYPQYLVLMVLWESGAQTVNRIAEKLILQTNTLTPLLKRMEQNGLVRRERSSRDEREVIVSLDSRGRELEAAAAEIPSRLVETLGRSRITPKELISMKRILMTLIEELS
jgi:DNA-binding MarR family transcriptional regulator